MTNERNYWKPEIGDEVWMNYPDHTEPLGVVVGFNPDDADHRPGQPVIKKADGSHINCHPFFLLPFQLGGPEWQLAEAEGRVG